MYALMLQYRNGILILGSGPKEGLENRECLTEEWD